MWSLFLQLSDGYLLGLGVWLVVMAATPFLLMRLRRRWKTSRARIRMVYAMLSAWLCLVPLTLLEVGFALLYDTTDSFDMTNVSKRWFQVHVQPDVKQLAFNDGTGIEYRDAEVVSLRPSESKQHVVFLGDSFTFGHGIADVENRFTNIIGRQATSDDRSSDYVISNLAWRGTDLSWVESVLQHAFASNGRIDRAVYVMCLNDIESFHDARMTRSIEMAKFEPPTFLFRDTYFYNWLYFRSQLLFQSEMRDYYSFVGDYYSGESWQRFTSTLDRTQALCRANDCELSVVLFPFMHNLGPDYPFRPIHEQIVQHCDEKAIEIVDLEPTLTAESGGELTVNRFDAHPNERAHRVAGLRIYRAWFSAEQ